MFRKKSPDTGPIYLDSASTTKVDPRVFEAMKPYFMELYGNASSTHRFGKIAKDAIEKARQQVADIINGFEDEIIFTSGATESINTAIKGYLEANPDNGNHIITVKTEHKAVLSVCSYLEEKGYEVTYLDVDGNGLISLEDLQSAIKPNTSLISVMYVNNEIGIIQPIEVIGRIAKEKDIAFFCDATQAVGKVSVDVEKDYIDMLCFSGHKLNGPKGIGALYKRRGITVTPLIHGGGQENGIRGGTYNTPLIVGYGKACELAKAEFKENLKNLENRRIQLEKYFEDQEIGTVNFKTVAKAPHILSVTLQNFEAEEYLMMKARELIASTGSACNAELIESSHVIECFPMLPSKNVVRISYE
ncbi:cysteine desulfurase family protein [Salinimicrobium oceani]|uniref:cysteine desulfurase n=1 Tax=Salinimicrobium oceani TaxID=2722702 RepID=A0ABX1D4J2_9FLAO|nr:cysteine desulfurase family protein [Salinimicrobium oceani]NJW54159.1 cysteine desulfurase [Salinimicrobium oceani]